jgi:hypothetical protein
MILFIYSIAYSALTKMIHFLTFPLEYAHRTFLIKLRGTDNLSQFDIVHVS